MLGFLPSGSLDMWFGLLEYHSEKIEDSKFAERHYYRKAVLFDRLLAFDVKMASANPPSSMGCHPGRSRVWASVEGRLS